jgi:hypothetical protein
VALGLYPIRVKSKSVLLILGSLGILSACSSHPVMPTLLASQSGMAGPVPEITRDEVFGPNRAQASVKNKKSKEYAFRNIASAFPDNGKNMLLKDRALPKGSVTSAVDHSPWHLSIYQNPDHIKENQERFSNMNKAFYATPLTQREAQTLAHAQKATSAAPFYQMETSGREDGFEPNNSLEKAFNLANAEDKWLALIGPKDKRTEGVQWDTDWYKILVSPHYRRVMVDLRYQQYLGDIDMKLYDAKGGLMATSQGTGEDEFLHVNLEQGGTYYIEIIGSNHGNRYDLKYSTYFTGGGDDEVEDNDFLARATDLSKQENLWLSETRGEGVAADDDYYKIQVPAGKLRVQVDLRYNVARGDVDVRLMNSSGKVIASSANIGDDDYIDFSVPFAGTYFIKVYPFAPQNTFNMYDMKWSVQKNSQKDANNLLSKTGTLFESLSR